MTMNKKVKSKTVNLSEVKKNNLRLDAEYYVNDEVKRKCDVCNKHDVKHKDYRFIDSIGFQGKILSCAYCVGLNDVAIVEIHSGRAIPEDYYEFIKEESNPKIALEGSKKE